MTPLRALVASRLSSLTPDTTSPESQRTRAEQRAEQLGAKVVGYAEDLDVSAFSVPPWDRPSLGWWLSHPERYDLIIARSIDRLARRLRDIVALIDWAGQHDVRLVFLEQDLDLGTPFGRATAQILGAVAELEASMTESRVKGAREHMRSVARWPAGAPIYGYRTCPHPSGRGYALEIDPQTGPVMLDIIGRVIRGDSVAGVTADLNARGVLSPRALTRLRAGQPTTRNGKGKWTGPPLWSQPHLRTLLRNPGLRAIVRDTDGAAVLADDGAPLRYADPPLVDDATWHALQKALDDGAWTAQRGQRQGVAELLHLVVCAECRHPLYRTVRTRYGRTEERYACRSAALKNTGCPGAAINADEARELIEHAWLTEVGDRPLLARRDEPAVDYSAEIAEVEQRLADLEADRYERGLFGGEDGAVRFAAVYGRLSTRLEWLRAQPTREARTWWEDTGWTLREEWEAFAPGEGEPDTRFESLRRRGVRLYVRGKIRDGHVRDRVTWDASEWELGEP